MPRELLSTTPNPGGSSGIDGGNLINRNAALDAALQAAVGIEDGATSIGVAADVGGSQTSATTDTFKERLAKIDNYVALSRDWTLTTPAHMTGGDFMAQPRVTRTRAMCTTNAILERPTVPGGTYYVDIYNGSDATPDGTDPATPFATISAAVGEADAGRILVAPGHYPYDAGFWTAAQTGGLGHTGNYIVERWPGLVGDIILSSHDLNTGWTLTAAQTYTYEATVPFTGVFVIDLRAPSRQGGFSEYAEVGSIAEVEATPGSYWNNGTTVYVHTTDGGDPTLAGDRLIVAAPLPAFGRRGDDQRELYLEGVTLIGGAGGFEFTNNANNPGGKAILRNVEAVNCGSFGIRTAGVADTFLEDCRAINNRGDGFNYIASGTLSGDIIEVRCDAWNNRESGGTAGNGSSAHADCRALRIGGRYMYNTGPSVADVQQAQSWNVSCYGGPSQPGTITTNASSGFLANNTAEMTLFDCVGTGNLSDLTVSINTATIYVDPSAVYDTFTDPGGRIQAYLQI